MTKQKKGKQAKPVKPAKITKSSSSPKVSFCKPPPANPNLQIHYSSKPFPQKVAEFIKPHFPKVQTYFSSLEKIFTKLEPRTSNGFLLNTAEWIQDISGFDNPYKFQGFVGPLDCKPESLECKNLFMKRAHILSPITYMSGEYVLPEDGALPSYLSHWQHTLAKVNDPNNEAYIDALFAVCASRLVEQKLSPHFVRCYGVFCGRLDNYAYNLSEDYDDIKDEPWFAENLAAGLYELRVLDEMGDSASFKPHDSKRRPRRSLVSDTSMDFEGDGNDLEPLPEHAELKGDEVASLEELEEADLDKDELEVLEDEAVPVSVSRIRISAVSAVEALPESHILTGSEEADDAVESDGADGADNADGADGADGADDADDADDAVESEEADDAVESDILPQSEGEGSSYSEESEGPPIIANFKNFPVMVSVLECCDGTMDLLLDEEEFDDTKDLRWTAWLFQVIAALAVAQKHYHFTHNDLHTNNIMWSWTSETTLYYTLQDALGGPRIYAVPTFGRIFKIIDFNRASFHLGKRGGFFISDAFEADGDASGQYNCEPYYNPKMPTVEPNPSFDLCRLACSLMESLFQEDPELVEPKQIMTQEPGIIMYETKSQLYNLIWSWLQQKDGYNVLKNSNGTERFPGFDLYKIIGHNVTAAVPCEQITKPIFDSKYRIDKKDLPTDVFVWSLPCSL